MRATVTHCADESLDASPALLHQVYAAPQHALALDRRTCAQCLCSRLQPLARHAGDGSSTARRNASIMPPACGDAGSPRRAAPPLRHHQRAAGALAAARLAASHAGHAQQRAARSREPAHLTYTALLASCNCVSSGVNCTLCLSDRQKVHGPLEERLSLSLERTIRSGGRVNHRLRHSRRLTHGARANARV